MMAGDFQGTLEVGDRYDGGRDDIPTASIGPRSFDGTRNNLANREWGSTDEQLLRLAPSDYGDGISTPAGADRPSAREISNAIVDQAEDAPLNDKKLSAFIYAWGQFIDHDIDLTEPPVTDQEPFYIAMPPGAFCVWGGFPHSHTLV
jgi:hypothetical protein